MDYKVLKENNIERTLSVNTRIDEIENEGYQFSDIESRNVILKKDAPWGYSVENCDIKIMAFTNDDGQKRYCIIDDDNNTVKLPLSRVVAYDKAIRDEIQKIENGEEVNEDTFIHKSALRHMEISKNEPSAEVFKEHGIDMTSGNITFMFGRTVPEEEAEKIIENMQNFILNFDHEYAWAGNTYGVNNFFHHLEHCEKTRQLEAVKFLFSNTEINKNFRNDSFRAAVEAQAQTTLSMLKDVAKEMYSSPEKYAEAWSKAKYDNITVDTKIPYNNVDLKDNSASMKLQTAQELGVVEELVKYYKKHNDRKGLKSFLETRTDERDGNSWKFKSCPDCIVDAIMEADVKDIKFDRIYDNLRQIPTILRKNNKDIKDNKIAKQLIKDYITSKKFVTIETLKDCLKDPGFAVFIKDGGTLATLNDYYAGLAVKEDLVKENIKSEKNKSLNDLLAEYEDFGKDCGVIPERSEQKEDIGDAERADNDEVR